MYKVYVKTDETGRIVSVNSDAFLYDTGGWTLIDEGYGDKFMHAQGNYLPKPIVTIEGVYRYKLVSGKVIERTAEEIQADIDAIPPPPPDPLMVTQKAARVMFQALAKNDTITEADALDNKEMFDQWSDFIGKTAPIGILLQYDDGLFRVQQAHLVQENYPPGVSTAALYTRIQSPGEPPAWVTGQSYAKDVQVTHNGKTWLSMVDNNVWEPGASGIGDTIWREVVE